MLHSTSMLPIKFRSQKLRISFATALFSGALATSEVWASGLDAPQVGTIFSTPTTNDAAAVFYNPARLGFLKKNEFYFGGGIIVGDIRYQRSRLGTYQTPDTLEFKTPLSPENIDSMKSMSVAGPVKSIPFGVSGDVFAAFPVIKDHLVLGGGFYVPYAAILNVKPKDGPQAWQIQQAFIAIPHLTFSIAGRVNDYFSIGAGISYVLGFAELSKLQDFSSVKEFADGLAGDPINQENDFGPNAPTEVRELDVLSRPISLKRAFSHGVSFNIGVSSNPIKNLALSLVYQHGSQMQFKGKFALNMNDDFFTQDLVSQGLQFKPLVEGTAILRFKIPKKITFGAAYEINDKIGIDAYFAWTFYRELKSFEVQTTSPDLAQPALGIGDTVNVNLVRNWKDTASIRLNGRMQLTHRLRGAVTLGYQSAASPDSTIDMASPDGHRLIGGFGGGYDINKKWSLYADATFQGIIPRTVTTSDFDLANGTYKLFIANLGLHALVRF